MRAAVCGVIATLVFGALSVVANAPAHGAGGLSISITSPTAVYVGTAVDASVVVRNDAAAATGAPTHLTVVTAAPPSLVPSPGWTCSVATLTIVGWLFNCDASSALAPGTSALPISMRMTAPNADTLLVAAIATDPTGAVARGEASRSTTVLRPDVVVSLAPGSNRVARNTDATLTLLLRNNGTGVAWPPYVGFTYSGFTQFTVTAGAGLTCNAATVVCTATSPLLPGDERRITATVHTVGGDVVGWIDAALNGGPARRNVVLIGDHADVALSGTAPAPAHTGTEVQFVVNARNQGAKAAIGPIEMEVTTSGLENPRVSGWNCNPDDPEDPEFVLCSRGNGLDPGASASPIVVRGIVAEEYPGEVVVDAELIGGVDPDPSNDDVELEMAVRSPIEIAVAVNDAGMSFQSGGVGRFDVTVSNRGISPAAGTTTVTFTVTGATASGSGIGWQCNGNICTNTMSIAAGASLPPLALQGTVQAPPGGSVRADVTVSHPQDGSEGDDSATDSNGVVPPDTTPPTFVLMTAVGTGPASVQTTLPVSWIAADMSGVAAYEVQSRQLRYDDDAQPAWTAFSTGPATSKSIQVTPGRTFCARVRAGDPFGNWSGFSLPRCSAVPLRADQLRAEGSWTQVSAAGAYSGKVRRTTTAGATLAKPNVRAEQLWVVASRCQGCGTVRVLWNATVLGTISLDGPAARAVLFALPTPPSLVGTATIEVTSSGKPVEIEGLALYRD